MQAVGGEGLWMLAEPVVLQVGKWGVGFGGPWGWRPRCLLLTGLALTGQDNSHQQAGQQDQQSGQQERAQPRKAAVGAQLPRTPA